jgi:hypothetical protein
MPMPTHPAHTNQIGTSHILPDALCSTQIDCERHSAPLKPPLSSPPMASWTDTFNQILHMRFESP